MGQNLKVVEQGFHRRQKHELSPLLKILTAEQQDAVDNLLFLMKSSEDKIKLQATEMYFKYLREISKDINDDQMQRLIANAKFGGPKELEMDDTPSVDFNQIQSV